MTASAAPTYAIPPPACQCAGQGGSGDSALGALQRAKWQLAVLAELAQPGHMELSPVKSRSGRVLDFEWRQSDPLAALTFGCAGQDMFGRRLRESFARTPLVAPLFDTYLRALLSRRPQFVRVEAGEGSGMHHARPSSQGVKVIVTSLSAVERVIAAQRAVRALEASDLRELRRFIHWDDARSVVDPLRAKAEPEQRWTRHAAASTRVVDSRI